MGLIRASNPSACGIAEMDAQGKITAFIEKPENPKSNLANAGIYVASHEIFDYFPEPNEHLKEGVLDFGYHILPCLTGYMYGYEIREYLRDIGTIESYDQAIKEWPEHQV